MEARRCQVGEISPSECVCGGGGRLQGSGVREKVEGHGTAGSRWASGEGGDQTPRMCSRICKALYPRSGIFPTWRPDGFARPGEPEGSLGRGKACPLPSGCLRRSSLAPGIPMEPRRPPTFLPVGCLGSSLAWLFLPRDWTLVIFALPGPLSSQGKLVCPRRGSGPWRRVRWEASF